MKNIKIEVVENTSQEKKFIKLPWDIYKDDSCWVPPIISDFKKYIRGKNNTLVESGPSKLIIALKDNVVSGRLLVGINKHLNEAKSYKEGYLSLFECINDYEVAKELFDFAIDWLKEEGMNKIIGPLSLPGGDDNRGLLLDNFNDPTLVMNTYNKKYYNELFEKYGFYKYWDCYAYKYDLSNKLSDRYERVIPYAMNKFKYKIDKINLKNIKKEINDVKTIIDLAMPEQWDDFIPPTDSELEIIAKQLVPLADPDLIYIARNHKNEPIGFNIALPDYNMILKKMNGKLFPFGLIKFLLNKNKMDRLRFFVLFVVPEYRSKGVTSAIYYEVYKKAIEKGYKWGEGSTVWEYNDNMMRDAIKLGAEKYKTYRIYKKDII